MPHLVGGTGIYSDAEEMPAEMPLRLEAGTGNETSFAGLAAALRWAEENPLDSVALNAMTDRLKQGLQEAGAKVIAPAGLKTPVVSFILDGILSDEVGFALMQGYDIICRSGLHCAPKIYDCIKYQCGGTVRLSLSRFTTEEEVDEVIGAVRQIAEGGIF
jgi:selenocysteine lyase/cysteine desulfurase